MAMENGPFEDVAPIENGIFQPAMLDYRSVTSWDIQVANDLIHNPFVFGQAQHPPP